VVLPLVVSLFLMALGLNALPSSLASHDHAVLGHWIPIFASATAAMALLLLLVVRTQQRSRARAAVNRALSLLAVASITTAIHLKGALTSYDILYYPLLVTIDRLREDRALARLSLIASTVAFAGLAFGTYAGWFAYAPLYPGRIAPEMVHDPGLVVLVTVVVAGTTVLSFLLIDFLATRVQAREQELRELSLGLAGRIEEQIELLRRSEGLRRYVAPPLAEAILRGEAIGQPAHQRLRLTVLRVDCPALAGAAEQIDPEDFAHLLNEFFAKVADLAETHGGTVDRFASGEVSVLFGVLHSRGAGADAEAAARLALEVLPAIDRLAARCEVAGIFEPPRGRVAIHTGFATVGSFGSPARLEFTAVGPLVDATSALLKQSPDGAVLATHASMVLLRDHFRCEPAGELVLAGARHGQKLYLVSALT
jgi:class 3 adenylate cyclase